MRIPALALACLVLAPGCGGLPAPGPRPDVLLVTLDTLRADQLGAYGAPRDVTPTLDALAARGVVFERMLAASSRTAPSHASIFTSRWVRDHAIGYRNGATRLDEEPTLAGLLGEAGYQTAAFVSNSMLQRRVGLDAGFALYDDALPDSETNRPVFERVAEKTTARATEWLARPRGGPRFVWVQYNDPHGPYTPPPRYVTDVAQGAASGPAQAPLPLLDGQRGRHGIPAYQAFGLEREPRQYRARYAGEIRYLDASLAALISAFETSAGSAGAIIAVTADHGESLGEEGFWFSHGFATTPNLAHVPFLLVAQGLPTRRVQTPVHHVDVLPTLLELAGVAAPEGLAGRALGPVARGEVALPEDRALYVDVGAELSVYRGDTFLRARVSGELGDLAENSHAAYRWRDASRWEPVETPQELLDLALAYERERAPLRFADEPSLEQRVRLRALGYLPPEPPAQAPATD